MVRRAIVAVAIAAIAGCGVDRAPAGGVGVRIMFELPDPGGAARDARGLFDLEGSGVYVAVTVRADDLEDPIVADWPDAPNAVAPAEIELLVPAGEGREFEALALVISGSGDLTAHGGRATRDLAGGTEIDLDLALEPIGTAPADESFPIADVPDPAQIASLHPVDVALDVLYPPAEVAAGAGSLDVHSAALPRGRDVRWTALLLSGDWVDLPGTTEVP